MATVTTNFDTTTNKYIFIKGLNKVFDTTQRKANIYWKNFFKEEKADRYIWDDLRFGGLYGMAVVPEGASVPIQRPKLDTTKRYKLSSFGTGFRITFIMKRFEQIELMKRLTASLRLAMDEGKDVEVATIYNNATSTSLAIGTGFDTLAIASAAHTLLKAGSQYSNYPNAALSLSALSDARYYFDTIVDDMGMIVGATPDTLYFHPALQTTVDEFFKSTQRPWELSNTKNVLGSEIGWKPKVYGRLGTATQWGVLAKDNDLFDLKVATNMEPEIEVKDAPDTSKDTVVFAYQLFTYGWGDPRMVYTGK